MEDEWIENIASVLVVKAGIEVVAVACGVESELESS